MEQPRPVTLQNKGFHDRSFKKCLTACVFVSKVRLGTGKPHFQVIAYMKYGQSIYDFDGVFKTLSNN